MFHHMTSCFCRSFTTTCHVLSKVFDAHSRTSETRRRSFWSQRENLSKAVSSEIIRYITPSLTFEKIYILYTQLWVTNQKANLSKIQHKLLLVTLHLFFAAQRERGAKRLYSFSVNRRKESRNVCAQKRHLYSTAV